jgi:hypothetical protein
MNIWWKNLKKSFSENDDAHILIVILWNNQLWIQII